MKPIQRAKWGKTAGAFALGAAAGSTLALLYAPTSGRVTRKKIGQGVSRAQKVLARKAELLKDAATEKLTDTKEWLVTRIGNGRHPAPRRVMQRS